MKRKRSRRHKRGRSRSHSYGSCGGHSSPDRDVASAGASSDVHPPDPAASSAYLPQQVAGGAATAAMPSNYYQQQHLTSAYADHGHAYRTGYYYYGQQHQQQPPSVGAYSAAYPQQQQWGSQPSQPMPQPPPPPPPPLPPPPPSAQRDRSPTPNRQPRSRLFKRSSAKLLQAQDPPQLQNKQQPQWVAALESSPRKQKPVKAEERKSTALGVAAEASNKNGSNRSRGNSNGSNNSDNSSAKLKIPLQIMLDGVANDAVSDDGDKSDDDEAEDGESKRRRSGTFQTRDEALKVLKQRRRARAAMAWKEKLVSKAGEGGVAVKASEEGGGDGRGAMAAGVSASNGTRATENRRSGTRGARDDGDLAGEKGGGSGGACPDNDDDGRSLMSMSASSGAEDDDRGVGPNIRPGAKDAKVDGRGGPGAEDTLADAMASLAAPQRRAKYTAEIENTRGEAQPATAGVGRDGGPARGKERPAAMEASKKMGGSEGLDGGDGNSPADISAGGAADRKRPATIRTILEEGGGNGRDGGCDGGPADGHMSPLTAAMNLAANTSDTMDMEEERENELGSPTAVDASPAAESRGGSSAKLQSANFPRKNAGINESNLVNVDDEWESQIGAATATGNLKGGSSIKSSMTTDNNKYKGKEEILERRSNATINTISASKKKKKQKENKNGEKGDEPEILKSWAQSNPIIENRFSVTKKETKKKDGKRNEGLELTTLRRSQSFPTLETSMLETPSSLSKKKKKHKKKKKEHQQLPPDARSTSPSPVTLPTTTLGRAHSEPSTNYGNDNRGNTHKKDELPYKRLLASDDTRDGVSRILQSNLQHSKSSHTREKHHQIYSFCRDLDGNGQRIHYFRSNAQTSKLSSARKKHHQNDISSGKHIDTSGRSAPSSQCNSAPNVSSYMDGDRDYMNSIVAHSPQKDDNHAEDYGNAHGSNSIDKNGEGNTPLMELWRRERRKKKKKKPRTTRLFVSKRQKQQSSNAENSNSGKGIGDGIGRQKIRKRHQLFRHQLLLPKEFSSFASSSDVLDANHNDGDCRDEGGCLPSTQGQKPKRGNASAQATASPVTQQKANSHNQSLWDIWDNDDLSSDQEEEKVEINLVGEDCGQLFEIQGRSLPYPDTLLWSAPVVFKRLTESQPVGRNTATDTSKKVQIVHSLRERIKRADAMIQSKAPVYIEFQAKKWMTCRTTTMATKSSAQQNEKHHKKPAVTNASAAPPQATSAAATTNTVEAQYESINTTALNALPTTTTLATQNINNTAANCHPLNYQEQQTFFTLPPRSKSYASANLAQDFLSALHSAAMEANCAKSIGRGDTNTPFITSSSSATSTVMEFLAIIKESRMNPQQQSPFNLMKKVWSLILSVVSHCDHGAKIGKELAQKFDSFLPEGYSMVSSNLLLLEGSLIQRKKDSKSDATTLCPVNCDVIEGCARTDHEFVELPFDRENE